MSTINKEQLREDLKASTQNSSGMFEIGEETICALMSLLTAPPSPVSVPDAYVRDGRGRMMLNGRQEPRIGYSAGWNACRAAMLQGAEPVSNRDELTDGWVACSERMPSPSTGVIVAAPWQSAPGGYAMKWATNCPGHPDADIDGWIIPGASWSPTHWMPLPAAPQQEV